MKNISLLEVYDNKKGERISSAAEEKKELLKWQNSEPLLLQKCVHTAFERVNKIQ